MQRLLSESKINVDGNRKISASSDEDVYDNYDLNEYPTHLSNNKYSSVSGSHYFDAISHKSFKPIRTPGNYMDDNKRKIDYILVYKEPLIYDDEEIKKEHRRLIFEKNLVKEGLQLEKTDARENSQGLIYLKIHAPFEVLCKYAQLMNIKMPIKEDNFLIQVSKFWKYFHNPFALSKKYKPKEMHYFTCVFNQAYMDRFLIEDKETFFDNAKRSRIVHEMLSRCKFDMQAGKFGLNKLISSDTYISSFPLHDGPFLEHQSDAMEDRSTNNHHLPKNDRQILYEIWTKPKMFYKEQPIGLVRKYFGEKIAIYFAWLGFYTTMLIPAALVGVLCFFYGLLTIDNYIPTEELCDKNGVGNLTMCPLCDELCTFWKLSDSCLYSKLTYLFDNPATIAFAIFMSFWSTLFLELWKRKQNELAWDWDTKDFEEEEIVRPEYETQVKTLRKNPITNTLEPYLPLYSKALRLMGAAITVLTFLVVVIGVVFGIILYKLSIVSVLHSQGDKIISQNAKLTTNISSAILNLLAILLLNKVYSKIATILTDLECPRTRTDYEDSYTLKMFLFQFVNYYSSLIYIAFFKGRYSGDPAGGGKIFGFKLEPCEPAGCMAELFIQFVVIMIGKQTLNNIQELFFPVIMNWWRRRSFLRSLSSPLLKNHNADNHVVNEKGATPISDNRKENQEDNDSTDIYDNVNATEKNGKSDKDIPQYQDDYNLEDTGPMGLFDEYLEMGIQFGFTTMFVAAFPLAPLFSLLNNIIEIRLDAFKFVTQFRRSISCRAQDIGVWYDIINVITKLSVITNAMIIAFTSDYIPKMVYQYHFSKYDTTSENNLLYNQSNYNQYTLVGYMNQSLSVFNLSYLKPPLRSIDGIYSGSYSDANTENISVCRYRDYRIAVPPFNMSYKYWVILVTRLAFVIIFEHFVFVLTELIAYLIPDMPYILKVHLARQRLLLRGALYEYDLDSPLINPEPGVSKSRASDNVHENEREINAGGLDVKNIENIDPKNLEGARDKKITIKAADLDPQAHFSDFQSGLTNKNTTPTDIARKNLAIRKKVIEELGQALSKDLLENKILKDLDEFQIGKTAKFDENNRSTQINMDDTLGAMPKQRISTSPMRRDASVPRITGKTRDSFEKSLIKSTRNI
ncbi:unnamed protein product [Gordionus sp. m RMFG-2023]|uniref:anoctamin-4-like isoform X2 n=1 Tax=Gordionus sp. m RMFG-2023 TaxID=3053472 RepID=UPI0030E5C54B